MNRRTNDDQHPYGSCDVARPGTRCLLCQDEQAPLCGICETRHQPTCGQIAADGLARMTPQQYFDFVDGVSYGRDCRFEYCTAPPYECPNPE